MARSQLPLTLVQLTPAALLAASPSCLQIHLSSSRLKAGVLVPDSEVLIQHHQDVGKCAMEERVMNTVIRAKQDGLTYPQWLLEYVGASDYDAEFVQGMRRNDKWHQRWDAYAETDEMGHDYTDEVTLEIDLSRLDLFG